jgi:catalase
VDGEAALAVHRALTEAGAVPRIVAARLGPVESATGDALEPDATLETMPSCLFDAVVVPDGTSSAAALCALGHAVEFVKDQYRHCKTILALGAGKALLEKAALPLDGGDEAVIVAPAGKAGPGTKAFLARLAQHRNWDRAMDPPPV